jgi:hypothetical protein
MTNTEGRIVLRVQWNWGGSKIIHAPLFSPIEESLSRNGFSAINDRVILLVAYKGKLINQLMTFHYYGISSGDHLICMSKKLQLKRDFPFTMNSDTIIPVKVTTEESPQRQLLRINDLAFTRCEMVQRLPIILNDLLNDIDQRRHKAMSDTITATVIPETPSISEAPMPTVFRGTYFRRSDPISITRSLTKPNKQLN